MVTAGSLSVSKGGIHLAKKTKKAAPQSRETAGIKSFLDMIAPSVVKFEPDHFICGNTFRCVWALREYPTQTDEQAMHDFFSTALTSSGIRLSYWRQPNYSIT